jgi:hypothetical protein
MQALVAVSVRLSASQAARLKEIAQAECRPVAAHVRSLILADLEERNGRTEEVADARHGV